MSSDIYSGVFLTRFIGRHWALLTQTSWKHGTTPERRLTNFPFLPITYDVDLNDTETLQMS